MSLRQASRVKRAIQERVKGLVWIYSCITRIMGAIVDFEYHLH